MGTKGFYNIPRKTVAEEKDPLNRSIQDQNVVNDLYAGDTRNWAFNFAKSSEELYNTLRDIVLDNDWHVLSLANQIPSANPKLVFFWVQISASSLPAVLRFFPYLNGKLIRPGAGHYRMRLQVASVPLDGNLVLPIDKHKSILYSASTNLTAFQARVLGWWE